MVWLGIRRDCQVEQADHSGHFIMWESAGEGHFLSQAELLELALQVGAQLPVADDDHLQISEPFAQPSHERGKRFDAMPGTQPADESQNQTAINGITGT